MAISMEAIKTLREQTGAGMLDCRNALEATNGDVNAAADWLREKGIAKAAKKASRIAAEGLSAVACVGNTAAVVEVNSETDFVAKNEKFVALVKDIANAIATNAPATLEEANKLALNGSTVEEAIVNATATIGEKISFRRFELVTKNDDEAFGSYVHMGGKIAALVLVKGADKAPLAVDLAMQVAALTPLYVALSDVPAEVLEHEKHIQMENAKNDPKLAGKPEAALEMILQGKVKKALSESCLLEQDFIKEPVKVEQYVKQNGSAVVKFVRYAVGEGIQKREENFAEEVMSQIK